MTPFLKLTPEACKRMRACILSEQVTRIGRIYSYQSRRFKTAADTEGREKFFKLLQRA